MLYFVVGLPGRFAAWCDAVVARLASPMAGPGSVVAADTLPEMAERAVQANLSHGVVASRRPGSQLRSALAETGRRFIVALDDPRHAVADLAGNEPRAAAAAIPPVASSCGAVAPYVNSPGALVIRAADAAADPVAAAGAIADHLDRETDRAALAGIVGALAAQGLGLDTAASRARWEALDADQRGWAEGALAGYAGCFAGASVTALSWVRELFFLGDRPDERASGIIDITGRARCLLQGPAIMIAPGNWSVGVKLLFSKETTEHEFLVEVLSDRPLASATVRPEREGRLDVDFPLTIDEDANQPLTIRLSSQRAAFDGACAMDLTVLTPQG